MIDKGFTRAVNLEKVLFRDLVQCRITSSSDIRGRYYLLWRRDVLLYILCRGVISSNLRRRVIELLRGILALPSSPFATMLT